MNLATTYKIKRGVVFRPDKNLLSDPLTHRRYVQDLALKVFNELIGEIYLEDAFEVSIDSVVRMGEPVNGRRTVRIDGEQWIDEK